LERLFHVSDARQGVLSSSGNERHHWYRLTHALWGTMAGVAGALATGLAVTLDGWTFGGATMLAGASAAATLAGARLMGRRKVAALPSPEPPPARQVKLALASAGKNALATEQMKGASAVTAVVLAMGLVPLELTLMQDVAASLRRAVPPVVAPAPAPEVPGGGGGGGGGAAPAVGRRWNVKPGDVAGALAGGAPAAASLAALLWMQRRRRRALGDGAGVFKELDLEKFQQLAQRTTPQLQRASSDVVRPLAALPAPDVFAQQALRRAVDLAPYLSRDTLQQLSESVVALCDGPGTRAENASVLARCIMETDQDQALRFKFLRLEGELEAQASLVWVERVRKNSGGA